MYNSQTIKKKGSYIEIINYKKQIISNIEAGRNIKI